MCALYKLYALYLSYMEKGRHPVLLSKRMPAINVFTVFMYIFSFYSNFFLSLPDFDVCLEIIPQCYLPRVVVALTHRSDGFASLFPSDVGSFAASYIIIGGKLHMTCHGNTQTHVDAEV